MHAACIRLNDGAAFPAAAATSTIIVSGAARSGTSLIAAALSAGGLWLGEHLDDACFEDAGLASFAERRSGLHRRLASAIRVPRQWRMAASGCDVAGFVEAIARRDAAQQSWGFKRPDILPRLGERGLALFRAPRVVMCFRDPVALAQRSAVADGVAFRVALREARRQMDRSLRVAEALRQPVLLVSFEKLGPDREGFLASLYEFCGMPVERSSFPDILAAMERSGENYRRMAAAPLVGHVDRPFGWKMRGWCRLPDRRGPAAVDVFANGRKLLTALADRLRPDLRAAGFKSLRHGFEIDLHRFGLRGPQTIDVAVTGSNLRLENSGFSLLDA